MSIDEAIKRSKEKAEDNKKYAQECEECAKRKIDKMMGLDKVHRRVMQSCIKCAEEQEQLAEWLEELKAFKSDDFTEDLFNMGYTKGMKDGYIKAIDEFAKSLKTDYVNFNMLYILQDNNFLHGNASLRSYKNMIDELAEEMKGGGE